jgi:hypothetical protein
VVPLFYSLSVFIAASMAAAAFRIFLMPVVSQFDAVVAFHLSVLLLNKCTFPNINHFYNLLNIIQINHRTPLKPQCKSPANSAA